MLLRPVLVPKFVAVDYNYHVVEVGWHLRDNSVEHVTYKFIHQFVAEGFQADVSCDDEQDGPSLNVTVAVIYQRVLLLQQINLILGNRLRIQRHPQLPHHLYGLYGIVEIPSASF